MLHILNIPPEKSQLMEVALKAIAPDDALVVMPRNLELLRQQPQLASALSRLTEKNKCELYALASDNRDLATAGLEIGTIDYPELVALAARHPTSQTWF